MLLVVPLGVLGSILFTMFRGLAADVYFNVGLVTIIGLAAKNAILIVEFAIEEEAHGKSTIDATLAAVKLRLRPIIMTSLAFVLGMVPPARRTRRGRGEPHRRRHGRRRRHARRRRRSGSSSSRCSISRCGAG